MPREETDCPLASLALPAAALQWHHTFHTMHVVASHVGMPLITLVCAAAAAQTGQHNFDSMSVHELKQFLSSKGISYAGLNEKSELISKAKAAG